MNLLKTSQLAPRFTVLIACCLTLACRTQSSTTKPTAAKPPRAVASSPAVHFLAGRIAGPIQVDCLLPPEQDPDSFRPDVETIQMITDSPLLLTLGATDAKWLETTSTSSRTTRNLTDPWKDKLIRRDDAVLHRHGPEGTHSHAGLAAAPWLDPTLSIEIAEAAKAAFASQWPENQSDFDARLLELKAELKDLDAFLETALAPLSGKRLLTPSPPRYHYLAKRYGFELVSDPTLLDLDSGTLQVDTLKKAMQKHEAFALLIAPEQIQEQQTQTLKTEGLRVVVFDWVGTASDSDDLIT